MATTSEAIRRGQVRQRRRRIVRHLHLTLALVGLYVGLVWIVQGVVALVAAFAGGSREGRGWWIFFGAISVIAGIVVVSAPVDSVTVLAVLLGIWFIVMGIIEIIGGLMIRRAARGAANSVAARRNTPWPTGQRNGKHSDIRGGDCDGCRAGAGRGIRPARGRAAPGR